jgi:hypothetical protein
MDIYRLLNDNYEMNNGEYTINYEAIRREVLAEEDKDILLLVQKICELGIRVAKNGIEIYPQLFTYEKRSLILSDFSEDEKSLLNELKYDELPNFLKARIYEVLFVINRDYKFAELVIEANKEMTQEYIDLSHYRIAGETISRALSIAEVMNYKESQRECLQLIELLMKLSIEQGKTKLGIKQLEVLSKSKISNKKDIIDVINTLLPKFDCDIDVLEKLIVIQLRLLNDETEVRKTKLFLAEHYEKEMLQLIEKGNFSNAERMARNALSLFQECSNITKARELNKNIVACQRAICENMKSFSNQINPILIYDILQKNIEKMSFEECMVYLTQHVPCWSKDSILEDCKNDIKRSLTSFVNMEIFDFQNKRIGIIEGVQNSESSISESRLFYKLFHYFDYHGSVFIRYIISVINLEFEFSRKDLDFLVMQNELIQKERIGIIREGLFLALKGEYYKAVHILVPQLENILRRVAEKCGEAVDTVDQNGVTKYRALASILKSKKIESCMNMNEDIIFLLRGLLVDPFGPNIRNEIAHGIVTEERSYSGPYIYFIGFFIKFLSYYSLQFQEIRCRDIFNQLDEVSEDVQKSCIVRK